MKRGNHHEEDENLVHKTRSKSFSSDSDSGSSDSGSVTIPWTQEEEKHLIEFLKENGLDWDYVASEFPHRTKESIKNHWKVIRVRISKKDLSEIQSKSQ